MKKTLLASLLSLLIVLSMGTVMVYAQNTSGGNPPASGGNPPIGGGNPRVSQNQISFGIDNPFKFKGNLYELVRYIIEEIVLKIGAVLCVLAFIFSGFLYVTAQGNASKIENANRSLMYSAIGTAVLLGSWTIAKMIEGTINQLKS